MAPQPPGIDVPVGDGVLVSQPLFPGSSRGLSSREVLRLATMTAI